jgi:hypothetical protein
MTSNLSSVGLGVIISGVLGIVYWLLSRKFRLAAAPSIWAGAAVASGAALVLVAVLFSLSAWTIGHAAELTDDPILAVTGAILAMIVAFIAGVRAFGKLPDQNQAVTRSGS